MGNFSEALAVEVQVLRAALVRCHAVALRSGVGIDPDKDQIAAVCQQALALPPPRPVATR